MLQGTTEQKSSLSMFPQFLSLITSRLYKDFQLRILSMSTLSLHAQRALERLQESWAVNQFIHSDALRNDAHCPSPGNPNEKFNGSREYYLGSLQVCHAGDTLNSYSQSIMGEIIKVDHTTWTDFDATIKQAGKVSREAMIANLLSHKGRRDGAIRTYLRDTVKCYWPFESEVIALLRNKFVHQSGHDPKRELEQLIASKKFPWCVICVDAKQGADAVRYIDSEWLDADVDLGQWACAHIRTHIHMMDQNLCHRFSLPRERWRPRPISRQLGSLPVPRKTIGIGPGQPLTTVIPPKSNQSISSQSSASSEPIDVVGEKAKNAPRLLARSTMEESECELAWHRLKDAISAFIDIYVKEAGVSVRARHGGGVGNWAYSVRGLELTLEYDMVPMDEDAFSVMDRVCIRLRERDLVPYVTIWSRKCAMKDFVTPAMNSEIENYLKDIIDKIITQAH